jgi:DNA-binding MarR family transcriptional regulator
MASTKDQVEIHSASFMKLHTASGLLSTYADRMFNSEISISYSQFLVLLIIDSAKPPVNQVYVAKKLHQGLNTTSMMVDRMVKAGLLDRTRSDVDRRENFLALAAKGKDKVTKGKAINKRIVNRLTGVFEEKEAQEILRLLTKLEEQILTEIA